MFRMVEGPSRLAGCWAPGIAESRLTSQLKAVRHEWAPPPATSHIPMPIVLYTQQRTNIPSIFPRTESLPCVWPWPHRRRVFEQI